MTDLAELERAVLARPGDLARRAAYAIACAEQAAGSDRASLALREARAAIERAAGVAALDPLVDEAVGALLAAPALATERPALRRDRVAALVARSGRSGATDAAREATLAAVEELVAEVWPGPFEAASVALGLGDAEAAVRWLADRPELDADADAASLYAAALLHLGDAEGAASRCEATLATTGPEAGLLNLAGAAALMRRDGPSAVVLLAAARSLAPDRPDILLNLVTAHAVNKAWGAALGVLDGLVDLHGPGAAPAGLRASLLAGLAADGAPPETSPKTPGSA